MSISLLYREADDDSMDKSLKSNITKTLSLTDKVWLILRSTSFKGQHVVQSTLRTCQSGKLMIRGFLSFNSRRKVCPFDIQTSNSVLSPRSVAKDNNKGSDECKTPRAHLTNETLQSPELEEEAAIRLQKVYRSFRTRRQLADCAIIVEQQWWKVIDFALLEQSSVLFFDLQKQESAVSRWSRARTRAAKVGKGLSKDEKAQKLALQHWLEAIDPRHRYGHNLHFYYDHWLQCFCGQPFFYWLDVGEGKEINLQEQCHRQKLQQQCIMYLGPREREAYQVIITDGIFMYKHNEQILNTIDSPNDEKWIFVLSTSKILYVGQKKKGRFQHSSFLAGGATSAAGRLVIEHGILKAVWPHSGHYRPTNANFQEFMSFLQQHGVDIADIRVNIPI
ncbi:IQ domain-containing protein IQM2-like [Zingiber officinale]|uniref:IQ domain-containing protein IQM2-like n=1 Tax=Zingiber officinale TaxID=94328 RepID=UPI001C4AFF17|nr:IQ domain-containing protein IQM2-like [Zingiber officinale]